MNTPTTDTGPGFLAFLAFILLAVALWFLMRNMNARMRRMSYRQQAAHRGKDEPQALDSDADRRMPGAAPQPPPSSSEADGPPEEQPGEATPGSREG